MKLDVDRVARDGHDIHRVAGKRTAVDVLDVEVNEGQMMEDVCLAVNGALPVEYFGYCGSQMPTTEEIKAKILKMKECK